MTRKILSEFLCLPELYHNPQSTNIPCHWGSRLSLLKNRADHVIPLLMPQGLPIVFRIKSMVRKHRTEDFRDLLLSWFSSLLAGLVSYKFFRSILEFRDSKSWSFKAAHCLHLYRELFCTAWSFLSFLSPHTPFLMRVNIFYSCSSFKIPLCSELFSTVFVALLKSLSLSYFHPPVSMAFWDTILTWQLVIILWGNFVLTVICLMENNCIPNI